MSETVSHAFLIDICNFHPIRFGRWYVGRLDIDLVQEVDASHEHVTITHPDPNYSAVYQDGNDLAYTGYTETAATETEHLTIEPDLIDGLPSVTEDVPATWTSQTHGVRARTVTRKGVSITSKPRYSTSITQSGKTVVVTSNFGGIASDMYAEVVGFQIGVANRGSNNKGPVTVYGKDCT